MTVAEQPVIITPETDLHIHLPAELIVDRIGKMALAEAQETRRMLSSDAQAVHNAALARTMESGQAIDIPSAAVWPGIVGSETVATMALNRRRSGRGLMQHPTDDTRHLIVPL